MTVSYHGRFKKQYKKLPLKIKNKFNKRLELFCDNPFNPVLNNHSLSGKYKDCRSIDVTGDIRAIYAISNTVVVFIAIGSHPQLYS